MQVVGQPEGSMDLFEPFTLIAPTVDAQVLSVLAARPDAVLTAGAVQRLTERRSESGVRRVLARLVEQGIVESSRQGPYLVYSFNRDHLAAPALRALARLRITFLEDLAAQLALWEPVPQFAVIVGRAAKGPMAPAQPIELLVVHGKLGAYDIDDGDEDPTSDPRAGGDSADPSLEEMRFLMRVDVARLCRRVRAHTGNQLRISEWTEGDVARALAEGSEVLREAWRSGEVVLGRADYFTRMALGRPV